MTRAVKNMSSNNANGVICDHHQNHIHLTNCIHLKHHMHKHSPELEERVLSRDLILLQRSLSLRNPSTSPCPHWHSSSVNVLLHREYSKNSMVREGRKSADIKQASECCTLLGSLPVFTNIGSSDLVAGEIGWRTYEVPSSSKISGRKGAKEGRRIKKQKLTRKSDRADFLDGKEDSLKMHGVDSLVHDVISRNFGSNDRGNNEKVKLHQKAIVKSFSEQPIQVSTEYDAVSCNTHFHRSRAHMKGKLKRIKWKKFQSDKRIRTILSSKDVGAQSEMPVSSDPVVDGFAGSICCMKDEREYYEDQTVTKIQGNGCGIPWNWSIIHHRGKTFLDMAGRTLSCGISDSRLKKGSTMSHGEVIPDILPEESDHSSSISKHDNVEALPLLVETSGPQESKDVASWVHDNYGELGIYADHMSRTKIVPQVNSSDWLKYRQKLKGRHQNLIQKYMPRTFRELVGQNLVVQPLSNVDMQSKVGLLYLFYGPHGTGKTSCARVFAQVLNCQSQAYPKPYGCCSSCIYHDPGNNEDQIEEGPVGLISDDILVDLLDFALSADTVKNLRKIIETGVEPLSLMSQMAAVIADILVGSHDFSKEKQSRKYFCCPSLCNDDLEKLRPALKTLSKAEKQLQLSNDSLSWMKAALLQLAPDQLDMPFSSSTEIDFIASPSATDEACGNARTKCGVEHSNMTNNDRTFSTHVSMEKLPPVTSYKNAAAIAPKMDRKRRTEVLLDPQLSSALTYDTVTVSDRQTSCRVHQGFNEIWLKVLQLIHFNCVREFLFLEGKLISISFGAAPTVQLGFSSSLAKSKAEKLRTHLGQAFESVIGSPVSIEFRCKSNETSARCQMPIFLPSNRRSFHMEDDTENDFRGRILGARKLLNTKREIKVIIPPTKLEDNKLIKSRESSRREMQPVYPEEHAVLPMEVSSGTNLGMHKNGKSNQMKISHAHVIDEADSSEEQNRWSIKKAISIAEKLEQENLKLESRSRRLLCWDASNSTKWKVVFYLGKNVPTICNWDHEYAKSSRWFRIMCIFVRMVQNYL